MKTQVEDTFPSRRHLVCAKHASASIVLYSLQKSNRSVSERSNLFMYETILFHDNGILLGVVAHGFGVRVASSPKSEFLKSISIFCKRNRLFPVLETPKLEFSKSISIFCKRNRFLRVLETFTSWVFTHGLGVMPCFVAENGISQKYPFSARETDSSKFWRQIFLNACAILNHSRCQRIV